MISKNFNPQSNQKFDWRACRLYPFAKFKKFLDQTPFQFLRITISILAVAVILLFFWRLAIPGAAEFLSSSFFELLLIIAFFDLIFESYLAFGLAKLKPRLKIETKNEGKISLLDFLSLESLLLLFSSFADDKKRQINTKAFLTSVFARQLGQFVFSKIGFDGPKVLSSINKEASYDLTSLLSLAHDNAQEEQKDSIEPSNLLYGAFCLDQILQKALFEAEVEFADLKNIIFWHDAKVAESQKSFGETLFLGSGIGQDWAFGYTLLAEKFGSDLTGQLTKKQINAFIVGREREIDEIEKILTKSNQANVLLVGPAGVGKNSTVLGLARKMLLGQTPAAIAYFRVLSLDVGSLIAGATGRGEIEERLKRVLSEVRSAGNVVLFIDEAQNLAGGLVVDRPIDLTGLLVETLSSPRVHVIVAVTPGNLRRYIESRPAFYNLFEKVELLELSKTESIRALEKISFDLENRYQLIITYKAIQAAVELSNFYIQDKVLPGKAIDLLESACSLAKSSGKKSLSKEEVESLITQKTKIPVGKIRKEEEKLLLNLEDVLHREVIDQNEAIIVVADALRRSRTMIRQQNRPIGNFLFLGPTGVGKTQTAKTLAASYFGSQNSMVRFDMTEFAQAKSVDLLIGSPSSSGGEVGGQLTEAVKNRPYCLILLDELEKAHQEVLNLFLQVFDDGRLVDSGGNVINFAQTIIIATSNAGSELIRERLKANLPLVKIKDELLEFLQKEQIFHPEFLNRFDEIVVFKPLSPKEIEEVTLILLTELKARLAKQDVGLEISSKALAYLARAGYDPVYGARPLRRVIQDKLESPLAKFLLAEKLKRGQTIIADEQAGFLNFSLKKGKFDV